MEHIVHSCRVKTPLWMEGESTNIVVYGCNLGPPESEEWDMTKFGSASLCDICPSLLLCPQALLTVDPPLPPGGRRAGQGLHVS